MPPIDYVVGNWYTSAHPKSMFTNNLLVQIVTDAGRTTLSNSKFTERTFDGESEERTLESAAELERVLGDAFGIELPVPAREIWRSAAGGVTRSPRSHGGHGAVGDRLSLRGGPTGPTKQPRRDRTEPCRSVATTPVSNHGIASSDRRGRSSSQ